MHVEPAECGRERGCPALPSCHPVPCPRACLEQDRCIQLPNSHSRNDICPGEYQRLRHVSTGKRGRPWPCSLRPSCALPEHPSAAVILHLTSRIHACLKSSTHTFPHFILLPNNTTTKRSLFSRYEMRFRIQISPAEGQTVNIGVRPRSKLFPLHQPVCQTFRVAVLGDKIIMFLK